MNGKRRTAGIALLTATAMALAACTGGASAVDQQVPRSGGTLEFLGPGGVDHFDPTSANYTATGQLLRVYARQLFSYPAVKDPAANPGRVFAPVPDVARDIPTVQNGGISADRLRYTIHLKDGVRWDTSPVREVVADDFVRGFKRLCNPVAASGALPYFTSTIVGLREYCAAYERAFTGRTPTAAALAAFQNSHQIAGVTAAGDKTLVFRLRQPANDFLHILVLRSASAAPREYDRYVPDSEEFRRNLRSNGPYRMTKYVRDREFLFQRNPAWSQASDQLRRQYVDGIHIVQNDTPADQVRKKIEAGTVDVAWAIPILSWGSSEKHQPSYSFGYALNPYLVFNLQSPNQRGAMRNLKVRQAIEYAVDRAAIAAIFKILDAPNRIAHGVIPPGSVGYREFNLYPTAGDRGNPAKCRQLLAAAGYRSGLTLVAPYRDAGLHPKVAKSYQRDLAKCGITVRLEPYKQGDYYGTLLQDPGTGKAGKWDLSAPGWAPDWFGDNGRAVMQPMFQTNCTKGTSNHGCYSNPRVDQLIAEALRTADPARAAQLWHQADVMVMRDAAIVPLLNHGLTLAREHSGRVRNAILLPNIQWFDITNIWLATG